MKFDINNPAFLQAAGNNQKIQSITRFVLTEDSGGSIDLSSNGTVTVQYIQGGERVSDTYSNLNYTPITVPTGVLITIYGAITEINPYAGEMLFESIDVSESTALKVLCCNDTTSVQSLDLSKCTSLEKLYLSYCAGLESLDVTKCIALKELNCNGCGLLTSLDVSHNTNLESLSVSYCDAMTELDIRNTASLTELDLNDSAIRELQVAGTSAEAYSSIDSWFGKTAPTNGTIYIDDNTPESVISGAESISWTVVNV